MKKLLLFCLIGLSYTNLEGMEQKKTPYHLKQYSNEKGNNCFHTAAYNHNYSIASKLVKELEAETCLALLTQKNKEQLTPLDIIICNMFRVRKFKSLYRLSLMGKLFLKAIRKVPGSPTVTIKPLTGQFKSPRNLTLCHLAAMIGWHEFFIQIQNNHNPLCSGINIKDNWGETPLFYAITYGNNSKCINAIKQLGGKPSKECYNSSDEDQDKCYDNMSENSNTYSDSSMESSNSDD